MTASPALYREEMLPAKAWEIPRITDWLRTERALAERHRDPWLRMFVQCIRFWAGDQWRDIIESTLTRFDTRQLRPIGAEDFRLVDNQIPIYCRHLVAVAAQNYPRIKCLPADASDPEDVGAAQIGTRFLQWRDRKDEEEGKREEEWLWLLGTGQSLRLTIYDAEGGDPIYGEGDILTQVVDPFRYLQDPQSIGEWPPKFLVVSEARHVDWIKEYLGATVEPQNVTENTQFLDDLAQNVLWGDVKREREGIKSAAMVDQFFIRPCAKYPEGWLYVLVGGEKLVRSAALQSGKWPLARAGWNPIPGRLYPMGLVEMMMGDQRQLNSLVSLLHEAASKAVRGDLVVSGPMAADGRGIRAFEINAKTGQKITPLPPGVQMVAEQHGADWTQGEARRAQISQNLHEKAGVNQPSLGQTLQKEARVGELTIAREGDLQISGWHLLRYAQRNMGPIARQKLQLAKDYYVLPRNLEGLGDQEEAMLFQGADLGDTRDVVTIAVPYMSPAMKQQAAMEAFGQGLRGPYENLAHQYAARSTLRVTGLDEMERELATVYGPFEELEQKVKQLAQAQEQIEFATAQAAMLQAQMMAQGGGLGPPGGQPPSPGGAATAPPTAAGAPA